MTRTVPDLPTGTMPDHLTDPAALAPLLDHGLTGFAVALALIALAALLALTIRGFRGGTGAARALSQFFAVIVALAAMVLAASVLTTYPAPPPMAGGTAVPVASMPTPAPQPVTATREIGF